MRWNACVHRLELDVHFHLKEVQRVESVAMLTQREQSPQLDSSKKCGTHDAVSHRTASPAHDHPNYSGSNLCLTLACHCVLLQKHAEMHIALLKPTVEFGFICMFCKGGILFACREHLIKHLVTNHDAYK